VEQVNKEACLGESIGSVGNVSIWKEATCMEGYEDGPSGMLCATCASTHALGSEGCTECGQLSPWHVVGAAVLMLILAIAMVLIYQYVKKKHKALIEVAPDLIGDIKVFLGLYQVLCSMGSTMQIAYPHSVENFLASVRSPVNIDVLAIPGLACRFRSTVINRFYVAVATPPAIMTAVICWYFLQKCQNKTEGQKERVSWDTCVGRILLLLFLTYTSICTNVFAIFHCFNVDDTRAYIRSDFRYSCYGSFYDTHFRLAILFTLLYTVGIPVISWCFLYSNRRAILGIAEGKELKEQFDYKKHVTASQEFEYYKTDLQSLVPEDQVDKFVTATLTKQLQGEVNHQEIANARAIFRHIDSDNSEDISKDELLLALQMYGVEKDGKKLKNVTMGDTTANGTELDLTFAGKKEALDPQAERTQDNPLSPEDTQEPLVVTLELTNLPKGQDGWDTLKFGNFQELLQKLGTEQMEVSRMQRPGPPSLLRLFQDYKPDFYWWEVLQYAEKFMLVGILGFVEPGSLTQATIGVVVSEVMLLMFVWCDVSREIVRATFKT
jgi:hypothetical protein